MGKTNGVFDERLLRVMSYLNRSWKIVLIFDILTLALILLIMAGLGELNLTLLLIILIIASLFSFIVARVLSAYNRMNKRNLEELRIVNEELASIIKDLEAFSFMVAHDLKTPLTNIYSAAYLLNENKQMSEDTASEIAEQIEISADKMSEIIDETLKLANIGIQTPLREPFQMQEVIENCLRRLNKIIVEKNAQIDVADSWPSVVGHQPWVEEIWVNYIINGLKYGGEPPVLVLGSDEENGKIRFWVHDNGNGIAKEHQEGIFKEFTRLSGSKTEGHGLGLAIVRRIAEKLDGEAGVESHPGEGSKFYFTLPPSKQ